MASARKEEFRWEINIIKICQRYIRGLMWNRSNNLFFKKLNELSSINKFKIVTGGIEIPRSKSLNAFKALSTLSKTSRIFERTLSAQPIKKSYFGRFYFDALSFDHDQSVILAKECQHFEYGNEWVANRNILFKPTGECIVLNNPAHSYNTIHPFGICNYLGLDKTYKQIGDLRFKKEGDSLIIECSFDKSEAKLEPLVKMAIEERARKEIPIVLAKGYAEKISPKDFYHGHPIANPDNPTAIYILYHTFEFVKPTLKKDQSRSMVPVGIFKQSDSKEDMNANSNSKLSGNKGFRLRI